MRTAAERLNSRVDEHFGLQNLKLRGLQNVVYHMSMVLSAMLMVAITGKLHRLELGRTANQLEERGF